MPKSFWNSLARCPKNDDASLVVEENLAVVSWALFDCIKLAPSLFRFDAAPITPSFLLFSTVPLKVWDNHHKWQPRII